MNIIQIKGGKIEIRKDNGALVRTIGSDAVSATFNDDQSLVVITTSKGKVEIRKENGALVRTIGSGNAASAKWHGSDIAISTYKGKTEIRKENGALIMKI
jgi:flagellar hook assembly protein FlgD